MKMTMSFYNAIVTFIFVCDIVHNYGAAGIPTSDHHFIESPKLSQWGEWGQLEHCPSDQVVVGMKLKVHDNQGMKDDTGLNAVKLYCQNPYSFSEYSGDVVPITSLVGPSGDWRKDFYCPTNPETKYVAVGFQLRSEGSTGVKDDTAGNNLKLICSDLFQKVGFVVLEGDGTGRGEWTKQQVCWPGYALCGLQTQVEISSSMDTTGLNNLKVRCCKVSASGNNTIPSTDNARSDESSSSEDNSSSMEHSHSVEKDVHIVNHQHTRGDHINSGENSQEGTSAEESSYTSPAEQELIAIDPEPTDFFTHNESPISSENDSSPTADDETPMSQHHEEHNTNSVHSSEDDSLPEEIANIDQVDNSEAQNEDEENASTASSSYSQHIPAEVINALEDVDGADSRSHTIPNGASMGGQGASNFTELNEIPHDKNGETIQRKKGEAENGSHDLKPKSSPRFGQVEVINSTAESNAHNLVANSGAICVGSVILLYFAQFL
ncbi:unnamed protein product [Orchesella dallaii]|uniref:Vitelline membrane outer layer protein 1 n=1 Tax=Orchesella dallaii TaxID=48710 RepID=A0ABP1S6Q0_9HEXA